MTSSNKKVKPSIMRSPSNAFQTRPGECEFPDGDERRRLLSSEKALTDIMSQTLKHAASSMFVTSFTTSAAFFTNMLTNISFVQVFGVFTGTCILLYFFITVTAIAAFAVSSSNGCLDLVVIRKRFSFSGDLREIHREHHHAPTADSFAQLIVERCIDESVPSIRHAMQKYSHSRLHPLHPTNDYSMSLRSRSRALHVRYLRYVVCVVCDNEVKHLSL